MPLRLLGILIAIPAALGMYAFANVSLRSGTGDLWPVFAAPIFIFYLWALTVGVRLFIERRVGLAEMLSFWVMQIPCFSGKHFSLHINSFPALFTMPKSGLGFDFSFFYSLDASFHYEVFQAHQETHGVNVVAICMAIYCVIAYRPGISNQLVQPTANAPAD